tara:strand:- start:357 stop:542 length:186 start_codon:yes stop_codon:yes gene_type:complete
MIVMDQERVITMELFALLAMELEKLTKPTAQCVTMSDLFLFSGNFIAILTVVVILIYLWRE